MAAVRLRREATRRRRRRRRRKRSASVPRRRKPHAMLRAFWRAMNSELRDPLKAGGNPNTLFEEYWG